MHNLTFDKSLCIPAKIDDLGTRGIDIIKEFPEAYVLPMAGIATPLHILYASKPVSNGKILGYSDLDTAEKVGRYSNSAISPDCALDTDLRADILFENRVNNLWTITQSIFSNMSAESVLIWSNNGIGIDSDGEFDSNDGVIRDGTGIAYGTHHTENGVTKSPPFFVKGLPGSYQNTPHDHIHIAPDTAGLSAVIEQALYKSHDKRYVGTFQEAREKIRADRSKLPVISLSVIRREDIGNSKMVHSFFFGDDCLLSEDTKMAGYVRGIATKHSISNGYDVKGNRKELIAETKKFYSKILK